MSAEMTLPEEWSIDSIDVISTQCLQKKPDTAQEFYYVDIGSIDRELKKISEPSLLMGENAPSRARKIINNGDILVSLTRPNLNAVALVPEHLDNQIASTGFEVIRPILIDNRYVFNIVRTQSFINGISGKVQGALYPAAKSSDVREYKIPIPSLPEQQQIAQILDELLAQVDTIKARLDAIPAILKRFRQSVLSAAVSGKLTEEWRGNTGYKSHGFSEDWKWNELPSSWNVNFFEEIVDCRLGKMLDKAKNFGKRIKYLGNINVRWFHFELTNLQEILVTENEQVELSLAKGDLLICEGGEPGRCAIWSEKSDEPIIFQKALHRARVKDAVIPEWIAINLKNDCDNQTLEQLFTGTTIKHLTGKALKKYPLRLPPINEQTEIVRQVDRFFTFADQVEQRVSDAKTRVDKLTQSILAKAFRGELTADWRAEHPELISGENSAEALLAKIQAAKAALEGKKKKGKAA
jgi:type I restriction enzyme S subunit